MRWLRRSFLIALVTVTAGSWAPSVLAASPCSAEVQARLDGQRELDGVVEYLFAVKIDVALRRSTIDDCSKVYIDFITTERLADGKEVTKTHRTWRTVTGNDTYKEPYRLPADTSLLDWRFEVKRCENCGGE